MPKNIQQDLLTRYNNLSNNPDLKASIMSSFKKTSGLYEIIYDKPNSEVAAEKVRIINEFFADLFDLSEIQWSIKSRINNTANNTITKTLERNLKESNFPSLAWVTKYRAGVQGRYALVIAKQKTGKLYDNMEETKPVFYPARVNYKNVINNTLFEIEVFYDDFPIADGKSTYLLKKKFTLANNECAVDTTLIDFANNKDIDFQLLDQHLKERIEEANEKVLSWDFIPIAILKNDFEEIPRMNKVNERLLMLNAYDEQQAVLPYWEKGAILKQSTNPIIESSKSDNAGMMRSILMDGMLETSSIDNNGMPSSITDNITIFNPNSIMKTMRDTRNDIYAEIKSDIGIPNIDEIKSAQQTTAELMVRQFLTSPIIERETIFMKEFLIDLAYKYLKILKTCNVKDNLSTINIDDYVIDVDLNVNTDKNVSNIISQANNGTINKGEATNEQ